MLSQIKDIAETLAPRLIEIRRHLHSHPELSGQEYQTAAYVSGVLSTCGLKIQEPSAKLALSVIYWRMINRILSWRFEQIWMRYRFRSERMWHLLLVVLG